MTTLALPSCLENPTSIEWTLVSNTQTFTSPLTGAVQTLALPAPRWQFTFTYQYISRTDIDSVNVWLARLRGMAGRFYAGNPARRVVLGAGGGTPLVNGASQTGTSLITDGWPISTAILKAGDFFSVNGELKIIIVDVSSDGAGNATLQFEPPLRASPSDNAAIDITAPVCTFRLANDEQSVHYQSYFVRSFTLSGIEVFA